MTDTRAVVNHAPAGKEVGRSDVLAVPPEPVQLDRLDWLAAQEPGADEVPSSRGPAVATDSVAGPVPLRLTREEPALNVRRFYELALVRSLWGEWGVVRQWGRMGRQVRLRTDWHDSRKAGEAGLVALTRSKQRRGYG